MTKSVRDMFRAKPSDGGVALAELDTAPDRGLSRKKIDKDITRDQKRINRWQERLYAEGERSLLVVLQGMDASGKDGTIKHVFSAMNPQGVAVTAFKAPTEQELSHDFLWRIRKALPVAGRVGVFNRSHYEDVIVVRVEDLVPENVWRPRFQAINRFEKKLVASGTTIVKIFLHLSFEEQRRRLLKRLEDPTKQWKFVSGDIRKRDRWTDYQDAYAEAIARCSIDAAPWYIVPADAKWYRNWVIGRLLVETFEEMKPEYPEPEYDVEAMKTRLAKA